MRLWTILISAFALALTACNYDTSTNVPGDTAETVGTMQLLLTGVSSSMQEYRLRDATFDIQGTRYTDYQSVSTSVSSEAEPDAAVARARLFYGNYTVSLRAEDWYLERVTPTGSERVAAAVLVSIQPQYVSIQQGAVSRVAFQFGVDGELVDFLGGELEIGIDVRELPDAGVSPPALP